MLTQWQLWAREIKQETMAFAFSLRDPRTPWWTKFLVAAIVAYALSPIDLIPDFIPVLGYLDDLVLIPLGILVVRRLIPPEVLTECRHQAAVAVAQSKPVSLWGAAIVVGLWLGAAAVAVYLGCLYWQGSQR